MVTLIYYNKIYYTLDYEPVDIETLHRLIMTNSLYVPTIRILGLDGREEIKLNEPDVMIALDKEQRTLWLKIFDSIDVKNKTPYIFKLKMYHREPIEKIRVGYQVIRMTELKENEYITEDEKIGIDFNKGKASSNLYKKILGSNISKAHKLGLV